MGVKIGFLREDGRGTMENVIMLKICKFV